ncbi:MAG: Ig-like domain-containing protein, partial [Crinalium sp.]
GKGDTGGNGGNGGYGGGIGGAGMGGAIFVRSGTLNLQNSAFNNNTTTGGNNAQGLGGAIFAMKSTTNNNGNNQGMPTTLPTVNLSNVTFSGNNAGNADGNVTPGSIGSGNDFNNDDLFGARFTEKVTPSNTAPVANNDNFNTNEDTPLTIAISSLLLNDTDADGNQLTLSNFTQPSNGTLTLDNTNLIYTPTANYNGTDSFTYIAKDGTIDSNTATVNLTVNPVNDAPTVATPINNQKAVAQTAFNFQIPANTFSDPDSNPLTYTATLANGDPLPGWLNFSNDTFSATPNNSNAGTLSINVTATDNGNLSTPPTTFNIAVASVINGTTANNNITGDNNNNIIDGGEGNDTITGGGGEDTIDGGTGTNTANYSTAPTGVSVNLTTGEGLLGDALGDILLNIQNLRGSNYNDTLIGDSNNNYLYGFAENDSISGGGGTDYLYGDAGNDTINGDDGNDYLYGGSGADLLNGGSGIDTVIYTTSTTGVNVDLSNNTVSGGDAQGDIISNFEYVQGSNYNDTITGDSNSNYLYGFAGDDLLRGGGGTDYLYGGDGLDTLTGANLANFGVGEIDLLTGNAGADTFVLGTNTGVLYNDGVNNNAGLTDYARILDFNVAEDVVQLTNNSSYYLGAAPTGTYSGSSGTGIFIDNDGTSGLSAKDELIGVLQGVPLTGQINNNTAGFTFVNYMSPS